ncbi:hypothetical protein CORC01_08991 [Colletotrichum orchidophilum]|uniref:Uncharacterized protein n=1 Tax=Colletotrichum orchidophilum TaxID=1209926 RepID=A0A1G4B2T9_9PEZI|nr:uncharacterized protein CORC01_08991 [Colletotrichum orchidophilum]OHE95707.1 hypothetical protein CORC01_08991 [Colletotrichum orchidophilum]
MEEDGNRKRALRRSTILVQVGRYQEPYALGVQKPAWVHPDPVFDPNAARYASFPTIPLDQRGLGDEYTEARDNGTIDLWLKKRNPPPEDFSDGDNEDEGHEQEIKGVDKNATGWLTTHESNGRALQRGESFKDFHMASTNSIDWGSPEPFDGLLGTKGNPANGYIIEWSQVSHGAQWALFQVLCEAETFASAAKNLKLTTLEVIKFVMSYVQYHREIKAWAKMTDEIDVFELLELTSGRLPPSDGMKVLHRPYLPTDTLKHHEYEQGCRYLNQVGQSEHVKGLDGCRGVSRDFHVLPIEPEIMATCIAILDKGNRDLTLNNVDAPHNNQPQPWHGQFGPADQELVNRLMEIQAYLPHLDSINGRPENTLLTTNPEDPDGQRQHQQHGTPTVTDSASTHLKSDRACLHGNPIVGENNQYAWVFENLDMDELYKPTGVPMRPKRPAVSNESLEPTTDGGLEATAVQQQDQPEEHQLPGDHVQNTASRLHEASSEAQSNNQPVNHVFPFEGLLSPANGLLPCPSHPEPDVDQTKVLSKLYLPVAQVPNDPPTWQGASSAEPQSIFAGVDEVEPRGSAEPGFDFFQSSIYKSAQGGLNLPQWYLAEMSLGPELREKPTSYATTHQRVAQEAGHQHDNSEGNSNAKSYTEPPYLMTSTDTLSAVSGAQQPRFELKDAEVRKAQQETAFHNESAPPPVGSERHGQIIDVANTPARHTVGTPQRHNNTYKSPTMPEDSFESPATMSSSKPSRKRQADDSDEEYKPKPKRARKPKKATPAPQTQPQQPAGPQQMSRNGILQPIKRGRGRPRKYPKPEDIVATQAANQAADLQAAANCSQISNAATPPASNPTTSPESVAPQASTTAMAERPRINLQTIKSSSSKGQTTTTQPLANQVSQPQGTMTTVSESVNAPSTYQAHHGPDFRSGVRQMPSAGRMPTSFSSGAAPLTLERRQASLPGAYSPRAIAPKPQTDAHALTGRWGHSSMPAIAPAPNPASSQRSPENIVSTNNSSQAPRPAPPSRDKHGRMFPPQYKSYEEFWDAVPDGADYALEMVGRGYSADIAMQLARERLAMNMASWPASKYASHNQNPGMSNAASSQFPGVTESIRREIQVEKATAQHSNNEQATTGTTGGLVSGTMEPPGGIEKRI